MNQKQATPVNVNLTLEPGANGTAWQMDVVGQGKGGPGNYPKIDIPKGSPETPFKFQITGPGTQNVTFSPDPLWVAVDKKTGSPDGPGVHPQIQNVSVTAGGKSLTFTDLNTEKVDLTYQLNFTGAGSLDPIISNGGGENQMTTYALLLGVILIAAIGLLVLRSRARTRARPDPEA